MKKVILVLIVIFGAIFCNAQMADRSRGGYVKKPVTTSHFVTAQTASQPTLLAWTVPADSNISVLIAGYINVTSINSDIIGMSVTWIDENNNSHIAIFYNKGSKIATISTVGNSNFLPMGEIKVKAGTTITVSTTITGGGSITYDAGATITKIR